MFNRLSMLTRAKARRSIASAGKLPQPKRKYSGEWLIVRYLETYGAIDIEVMKQLTSNSRRKVIVPRGRISTGRNSRSNPSSREPQYSTRYHLERRTERDVTLSAW